MPSSSCSSNLTRNIKRASIIIFCVNISLWYVDILPNTTKRMEACRQVVSVLKSHRPKIHVLPLKTKTQYPETRNVHYLLNNETLCLTNRPVSLLYVVSSKPSNLLRRQAIRQTFANSSYFKHNIVRVVFFVGTRKSDSIRESLIKEHQAYGDVIQGDFVDKSGNQTRKSVIELHWLTTFCRNVQTVAQIDDGTFVDTVLFLLKYQEDFTSKKVSLSCNWDGSGKFRVNKWEVLIGIQGYKSYPWLYCSGFSIFMTSDVISILLKAATFTPHFEIDDLYISGILRSRMRGLNLGTIPHLLNDTEATIGCFLEKTCNDVYGRINIHHFQRLWNYTVNEKHGRDVLKV